MAEHEASELKSEIKSEKTTSRRTNRGIESGAQNDKLWILFQKTMNG